MTSAKTETRDQEMISSRRRRRRYRQDSGIDDVSGPLQDTWSTDHPVVDDHDDALINVTQLDCDMRHLTMEYAEFILSTYAAANLPVSQNVVLTWIKDALEYERLHCTSATRTTTTTLKSSSFHQAQPESESRHNEMMMMKKKSHNEMMMMMKKKKKKDDNHMDPVSSGNSSMFRHRTLLQARSSLSLIKDAKKDYDDYCPLLWTNADNKCNSSSDDNNNNNNKKDPCILAVVVETTEKTTSAVISRTTIEEVSKEDHHHHHHHSQYSTSVHQSISSALQHCREVVVSSSSSNTTTNNNNNNKKGSSSPPTYYNCTILLGPGIHSLTEPLQLSLMAEPDGSFVVSSDEHQQQQLPFQLTIQGCPTAVTSHHHYNNKSSYHTQELREQQQQQQDVWISGGIEIPTDDDDIVHWTPQRMANGTFRGIWKANLTKLLEPYHHKLPKIVSLFGMDGTRYTRARYPNPSSSSSEAASFYQKSKDELWYEANKKKKKDSNNENKDKGRNEYDDRSPLSSLSSTIPLLPDLIYEWIKPPSGPIPSFDAFHDFAYDPHYPKNDSTMVGYNWYASGRGGVCDTVWDTSSSTEAEEGSYWCSNASAGGWAEVDEECATTGQLQIPIGLHWNPHQEPHGTRFASYGTDGALGAIIHAKHSQSWSMHMFEINQVKEVLVTAGSEMDHGNNNHDNAGTKNSSMIWKFSPHGGNQGGRNWCRCDQCTYAGGTFCGQHHDPPDNTDDRLIGGEWFVENVLAELDMPGEFYLDRESLILWVYPNETSKSSSYSASDSQEQDHLLEPPSGLRLAMLQTLVDGTNASHVTIQNLGFRDTTAVYLEPDWGVPSGGDWSLHRSGAVFLENATDITIHGCSFSRLDGNAVFLSRMTRNITISNSVFEWLGQNAIAMWGETQNGYDGTKGTFPVHTTIIGNVFRELGLFEKQSSAVGIAKAALTTIVGNLMFNMPRAAINFNDLLGGADEIADNILFNTCRESGDHGPINSWDRQPMLHALGTDNGTPSFVPLARRAIHHNLIIANYGASQGVDNDDGSSWYHLYRNVFYIADFAKMDYGGHDSIYEENLAIGYPYRSECVGFGDFFPGHGHVVRDNVCIMPNTNDRAIINLYGCDNETLVLQRNLYLTPDGNATVMCSQLPDLLTLADFQEQFSGLEVDSIALRTPSEARIVKWAQELLFPKTVNDRDDIDPDGNIDAWTERHASRGLRDIVLIDVLDS